MIYFVILFLMILSIFYFDILNKKNGRKKFFITIVGILIFLSAFSYRLGMDVVNSYMPEFEYEIVTLDKISYDYLFQNVNRQFGWLLLQSISKTIFPSFTLFKLIHSFIINVSIGLFIYKFFRFKFTALLCYYFFAYVTFNFEVLREAIAIAIFLISTQYLLENKYKYYYILIMIAISFHIYSFVLLFFPLLFYFTKRRSVIVGILLMCIISLLFVEKSQQLFSSLIFIEAIKEKSLNYMESEKYGTSILSFSNIINYILNIVAPIILILQLKDNENVRKFTPYILAYVIIYTASLHIFILFRFNNYFKMFFVFAYIEMFYSKCFFKLLSHKKRLIVLYLAVVLFCYMKFNTIAAPINEIPGYYRYYPYSSIFDKKLNVNRERIIN